MKTQLSKPARGKASYSDQYKREAVELQSRLKRKMESRVFKIQHFRTGTFPAIVKSPRRELKN
jgi:hypothetical protein